MAAAKRFQKQLLEDPAGLARVQTIVARIYRVADKEALLLPEAAIVGGNANAEAAEGHFLFVSASLLRLLPDDNHLALVLGHEIAHLTLRHTEGTPIENEIGKAVRLGGFQGSLLPIKNEVVRRLEAEADRYGFLYVVLAGYDVSDAADVLDKILLSNADASHPSKEERQRIFRERLRQVFDSVEVFHAGGDYYLRGNFPYASQTFVNLLNDGLRSREVYHNLGATLHRAAFGHLVAGDSPPEICAISFDLGTGVMLEGSRGKKEGASGLGFAPKSDRPGFLDALGKAIQFYERALQLDSGYAPARSNLGCAYLQRGDAGDVSAAVGELEKAVKLDENSAVAANNLGVAYLRIGDTNRGVAQLRRALELNRGFAPAQFNLALVMRRNLAGDMLDSAAVKKELQGFLKVMEGQRQSHYVGEARQGLGLVEEEPAPPAKVASSFGDAAGPPADLPVLPGALLDSLPPNLRPESKTRVVPDKIELWRFSGWQILVDTEANSVDEVTISVDRYRTSEKVGVGSTADEVSKAYGAPAEEEARGSLRALCYPERGLLFRLRDGRVISWSAFRKQER